jgi:hypothetical protein
VQPTALARIRWRAAEDRLYPTLIADPAAYERALAAVQAVLQELRLRCADAADLVAVEEAPDELIAAALPAGVPAPVDLLVGAACAMRDREISVQRASAPGSSAAGPSPRADGGDRQPPGGDERGP